MWLEVPIEADIEAIGKEVTTDDGLLGYAAVTEAHA
jgi:hypothetical protein